MTAYQDWIDKNVPNAIGTCAEATKKLVAAYPELTRVRGHYLCPAWGSREHWWTMTPAGGVVDPTASQFPSRGFGEYIPWDEDAEEPTGKCLNCGEYTYGSSNTCSDRCSDDLCAYMERGRL